MSQNIDQYKIPDPKHGGPPRERLAVLIASGPDGTDMPVETIDGYGFIWRRGLDDDWYPTGRMVRLKKMPKE